MRDPARSDQRGVPEPAYGARADRSREWWPLVVAAAVFASACATAPSRAGAGRVTASPEGPATGPSGSGALVRRAYGPPVRGADGLPVEHPWLGGFNQPRPQLADVDGDGDLDLFVQERSGRVGYFENLGDARVPRFAWRSDRFQDLDVGEWFRFADLDADGDPDLLGESRYSHVRLWRNDPVPGGVELRPWADSLRDAAGQPIFSDRQNIPNAVDIDCDGLVDLFVGRLTGTVSRYEEQARDASAAPRFALVTDRFENIEIIAQLGSLHGANTLALGDADGDGDVDLFWGDFFEPGLLLIENTGPSCDRPVLDGPPRPFPLDAPLRTSGYNAPALGDLDGDGDLDLLVGVLGGAYAPSRTTVENLWYLEQVAGSWHARSSRFLSAIDVGSESVPAVGDWDGDGDLDLLVGSKITDDGAETARLHAFENVGAPGRPEFRHLGALPIAGGYHYAPALGDLDGDGDADLLLGTWQDGIRVFRNDGGAWNERWTPMPDATLRLSRGANATPTLGDVDGDGDLDLVAGESSGELNFWRNEGTPGAARFELVTDRLAGVDAGRRSAPLLVDWDGDGRLDLLVGSEAEILALWRGGGPIGGGGEPGFERVPGFSVDVPAFGAPAAADADGDGDLDLFVGGIGGGVVLLENRAR